MAKPLPDKLFLLTITKPNIPKIRAIIPNKNCVQKIALTPNSLNLMTLGKRNCPKNIRAISKREMMPQIKLDKATLDFCIVELGSFIKVCFKV